MSKEIYLESLLSMKNKSETIITVMLVIMALVALNVTAHITPLSSYALVIPVGVGLLIAVAKFKGITWHDLGLGSHTLKRGSLWTLGAILAVSSVIALLVVIPPTREMFLNESYMKLSVALVAALIVIPFQTVIPEELAFRGILHSRLKHLGGIRFAIILGSLLFGAWHILSSMNLTATNVLLTQILGSGIFAQIAGIAGAVIATSAAGAVLLIVRQKSKSILPSMGLHWALNSSGAIAAAMSWNMF